MTSSKAVRQRIAQARKARGLSQNDVEKLLGVPGSGLMSGAEKGPKKRDSGVPSETLLKIATALQVRPGWLLSGEEPMEAAATDPLPRRTEAVRIAREGGISEKAIGRVLSRSYADPDHRTTLWWIKVLELEQATLAEDPPPSLIPISEPPPVSSAPRTVVVKGNERYRKNS